MSASGHGLNKGSASLRVYTAPALLIALLYVSPPSLAQRAGPGPPPPTPQVNSAPTITPVTPQIPVFTFTPTTPNVTPLIPLDVTSIQIANPIADPSQPSPALAGVRTLSDKGFPKSESLKGSTEGIVVRAQDGARYDRPNPYTVAVIEGGVLISVKRPSQMALVKTPLGEVAVASNGDVMVSYKDGVMRLMNVDGLGDRVRFKGEPGVVGAAEQEVVAIKPGFEIVAGQNTLERADLRPSDGVARRHSKVFEGGRLAVSEFSVESLVNTSGLVASMAQKDAGTKEKRILGDMSKMASVLNMMNGTQGYVASGGPAAGH